MDDDETSCVNEGPTPSQLCKGPWPVGHGRADEVGPSLARDVEEASAGNGRAQSSVPTFLERRR